MRPPGRNARGVRVTASLLSVLRGGNCRDFSVVEMVGQSRRTTLAAGSIRTMPTKQSAVSLHQREVASFPAETPHWRRSPHGLSHENQVLSPRILRSGTGWPKLIWRLATVQAVAANGRLSPIRWGGCTPLSQISTFESLVCQRRQSGITRPNMRQNAGEWLGIIRCTSSCATT